MSQIFTADLDYRLSCRKCLMNLIDRNDYKEAVRYFESIQNAWKDQSDLESGILMRLGAKAYGSSRDYSKALPLIRISINIISRNVSDGAELGECFMVLGAILREMGQYGEAEKAFRDAESIFRRNDDIARSGDALNLLAGILFRKGDLDASLGYLLEAVEAARKENDKRKLAYLFGNIGRVYTFLGKLDAARENVQLNIELSAEFNDAVELARAYLSLGYIFIRQYRFDDAQEALEQALGHIDRNKLDKERAIYLTYAGELALRSGQYEAAEQMLADAATLGRKVAPDSLLPARPLRLMAELTAAQGNHRKALTLANQAMLLMKKLDDAIEIGALHRIIGLCFDRMGQKQKALEAYGHSLDILEEHKSKPELAETLDAMGQSPLYDAGRRTMYLCRAEELYGSCGIGIRVTEMQKQISEIEVGIGRPQAKTEAAKSAETDFPTRNRRMAKIISQLYLLKNSDLPILLTGETGTGKDYLARYFHSISRPGRPYLAINCAAMPENLIESELFGYKKGAFTGADQDKKGLFLAANNGVLLLDEIGELPLGLQAKLLSVLETKKLRPLGTSEEVPLNIIIVAATNRDLYEMVKNGQFRLDLYYRLAGITIELPPLRERKEDIPGLLELFMARVGLLSEGEKPNPELVRQFISYDWPGNIRQMENKVKQLSVLSSLARDGSITELALTFFEEKRDEKTNSLFEQVEQFEKRLLIEALIAGGGNKSEAARILSIHESTLRAKLKRYSLETMVN